MLTLNREIQIKNLEIVALAGKMVNKYFFCFILMYRISKVSINIAINDNLIIYPMTIMFNCHVIRSRTMACK